MLITTLVKQWYLGKLQGHTFCRKAVGILAQDFKEMWQFLYTNLTVFTGTFDDLYFSVKTVKFSCKNRDLLKEIVKLRESFQLFHENFTCKKNLPIYMGKFNSFYKKM